MSDAQLAGLIALGAIALGLALGGILATVAICSGWWDGTPQDRHGNRR